jgi:hypothetical protein
MPKAKQKSAGRQPAIDIGAELLTSVREMKAGIRIIGAGYWRKGKAIYEREN